MFSLFFFIDTTTTEIYTLSLHDALPIFAILVTVTPMQCCNDSRLHNRIFRSEEHTSELQSRRDLVCRLLLEKKKTQHGAGCASDPRPQFHSDKPFQVAQL